MGKIIDHNNFWYIEKNPISKTGVFPYLGREIGYPGLEPNKIYYVLRSEQELMSPEAIKSFELLPITKGHRMLGPQEQGLTPAEKIPQQGIVGEKVFAEGDTLYANIKVTSEQAKNDINNGLKELSLGYFCQWVKESGDYKGQHYDFAQKNIRGNHLAIVPLGRMGHEVRVMDALPAGAASYACDSLELAGPFISALLPAGHKNLKLFNLPGQAQDFNPNHNPDNGRFCGKSSSGKNEEKTISPQAISITGEELDPYTDIKDLRAKAVQWYKENLQGKYANNPVLGKVLFSRKGLEEFKAFSANPDKLKMVVALKRILDTSKDVKTEGLHKVRKDGAIRFHRVAAKVKIGNGEPKAINIIVWEDREGNKFYDLEFFQKRTLTVGDTLSQIGAAVKAINSIAKEETQIKENLKMDKKLSEMSITEMLESADDGMNLFIEEAEDNMDITQANDAWNESDHPRKKNGEFAPKGQGESGGATEIKRKQEERAAKRAEIERRAGKFEAGAAYKKAMENNPNDEQAARVAEARSLSKWSKTAYENPQSAKSVFFTRASQNDYIKQMDRGWLEDIFNSVKGTKTNGTDGISAAPEDKEEEKMDKREVIREIMAISARPVSEFKGGEEEKVDTILKLAEKLAYNPSETGANDEDPKEGDGKETVKEDAKDACAKDDKSKAEAEEGKKEDDPKAAMDAMEARIAANFAKKASLYEKISPFIGTFDHNPMSFTQMAKYACDKLGIKGIAEDGAETALIGYLSGAKKQAVVREEKDAACDAFPVSDPAFKKYLEEAQ